MEHQIASSPKVDFAFLLSLALKDNLAWNSLSSIVDNMTLNQDQSKNMIKVLLKELQQLQAKLQAKQDAFDSVKQASHEETELETVESDVASENDIQFVKDYSEDEHSLIDPEDKQTENELLINDEQITDDNNSEKVVQMIDDDGDYIENRSKSEEIENESLESKEPTINDELIITNNEIPNEASKRYKIQKKHQCNFCKKDFFIK